MKSKRIENRVLIDELKEKHSCIICGNKEVDIHHIKTKKSGGDDVPYNLVPLCRVHHSSLHSMGIKKFAKEYILFEAFLLYFGWELNALNKWVYNNKE